MSETEATAAPTAEEIKGTKRAAEVSSFLKLFIVVNLLQIPAFRKTCENLTGYFVSKEFNGEINSKNM